MNDEKNSPAQSTPVPSQPSTWKSLLQEIIIFLLIAVCIVLPFRIYIAEPYIVDGPSMNPTFATGDYLIVDKISYEIGNPQRNSIVIFKFPTDPSMDLIKRVIGLPGDTVTVKNGAVTISYCPNAGSVTKTNFCTSFPLDESYLTFTQADNFTVTLGPDQYFVMGDNRPVSYDSRSWGILPRKDIIGRPLLRLLPLSEIGFLPGDDTKGTH